MQTFINETCKSIDDVHSDTALMRNSDETFAVNDDSGILNGIFRSFRIYYINSRQRLEKKT